MEVLKPTLIWVDGVCYRKNTIIENEEEERGFQDDFYDPDEDDYCMQESDENIKIEETEVGFKLKLNIPDEFYKFIIGKGGETKKKIENETRTQIRIPKQGIEGDVFIDGRDKKGILSAKMRIDLIIDSAREKIPFTHFLSLPVTGLEMNENFNSFIDSVLWQCKGDRGLEQSIFQNPSKLHMTLGTLTLLDSSEIQTAADLLKKCYQEFIGDALNNEPLKIEVRGLEYMNDDPSEVDVLYAKIHEDGRLQMIAEELVNKFSKLGFMKKQYDQVKMHITLMNTLFRKDPNDTSAVYERGQERESFNASGVLKAFEDYYFSIHTLNSIHLSIRYSTSSDGYYKSAAQVQI